MRGPIVQLLSLLTCLCVLPCVAADEEAELVGHDESVIWLEFSPDGTLLASASRDKTASIWRIVDGARLATFTHTEQVCRVAFSPDSRLLASVAFDAKVRLWQITPPRPLATLEPHRLIPDALTFSPDGRRLLSGSPGEAKVWDVEKQRLTRGFARTRLCLAGSPLKFFPDGKELVSGVYSAEQIEEHDYSAQAVRAWKFDSREVADLFRPLFRGARDIAISRDGRKLVIVGESRGPRVIDVTTRTSREVLQGLAYLTRVELVHDDRIILANGKGIAAWDLDSGVYLGPVGAGIVKGSFAISPDGAKVAYSANSRDIRVVPLERIVPRDLKARIARGEAPDYSLIRDGSVKQLEGTWEPKKLRAKPLAKDDHGMQVIFKDGRMTVDGPDGEKVVHLGLSWVEIQSTAVEKDRSLEVFSVSVASDTSLDSHDLTVESFGHGIGDAERTVAYHVLESLIDGPGYLLHRFKLGVNDATIPVFKVHRRRGSIVVMPKVSKHLLVRPCFPSLQL